MSLKDFHFDSRTTDYLCCPVCEDECIHIVSVEQCLKNNPISQKARDNR